MSLQAQMVGPIPDETVRVARAAFPKGNGYLQIRDARGGIFDDASVAPLFARRGRPAEAPWRLALVTVMQFAEGLSDRQAAEAVRARIDWKYALGLALDAPGFDFSVLSAFRARLVAGAKESLLLDAFLVACTARGLLRARGRQRTDSTHVLGALRVLNRLEQVAETLRATLNVIAIVAPEWLQAHVPADWFARYGRRIEDYRLPKGKEARQVYAVQVGADGLQLLADLYDAAAPPVVRQVFAVDCLRRTWVQQYGVIEGQVRLREPTEMPSAADQIESPYEEEARFGTKRELTWVGYKVHLTETCDDALPHLVTEVETTIAPVPDVQQLATIQAGLARSNLLPAQQLIDTGDIRAQHLVSSQVEHQVELLGPMVADHQWQAKANNGFAASHFVVDWQAQQVRCPAGQTSIRWTPMQVAGRQPMTQVGFSRDDCVPCPSRALCTRAKTGARALTLPAQTEYEAIQAARARQQTATFKEAYARRAGVEGTLSQGVRVFGLRRARYRGLAKTHLQHVATAATLDVSRLSDRLSGVPRATTRRSPFAALAA